MITKIFYPHLSKEQLNETMRTQAEFAYPELIFNKKIQMEKKELRNRIIGMIIITPTVFILGLTLIVNVFQPGFLGVGNIADRVIVGTLFFILALSLIAVIPPAKKWNEFIEKVVHRFYSSLCIEAKINDFKTYLILAPNIMSQVSEDEFIKTWEEFDQAIETEVKTQESATCNECGQIFEGLWSTNNYWFEDYYLKDTLILLRCINCESVYCSKCYVDLKDRHTCPKCGKKMKEIAPKMLRGGLGVFFPQLKLIKQASITDIKIDQKSDDSADTFCEVTYNYKYEDIVEPRYGSTRRQIELGDQGKVICQFKNKAIKIGNEWRFIADNLGTLKEE